MQRVAWLTDLHLNFVPEERRRQLAEEIQATGAEALLISGDLAEADSWKPLLEELAEATERPAYFVLGNHDYYRSSIAAVRQAASMVSEQSPRLIWLGAAGIIRLSEETVLLGHDGWGDARTPEFRTSDVVLNDYLLIDELRAQVPFDDFIRADSSRDVPILTAELQAALQALGDESAEHFARLLPEAAAAGKRILVVTHVPPFREACWHDGRISDDNWAPHFTCVAVGTVLADFMRLHPAHEMLVLCGHTHSAGDARVLPNLRVLTGRARYGEPCVQQMFDIR